MQAHFLFTMHVQCRSAGRSAHNNDLGIQVEGGSILTHASIVIKTGKQGCGKSSTSFSSFPSDVTGSTLSHILLSKANHMARSDFKETEKRIRFTMTTVLGNSRGWSFLLSIHLRRKQNKCSFVNEYYKNIIACVCISKHLSPIPDIGYK